MTDTEDKMTIYVVSHKKIDAKLPEGYKGIAVGPLAQDPPKGFVSDNTGDNISNKNANYCELTAQYWIWKNDNESDIIGLCHYRRFFTTKMFSNDRKYILNRSQIIHDIKKSGYDIILPVRPIARRTVKEIYLDYGFEKDLDILREVISQKYPQYVSEYDSLLNRHSNYIANMMITKKETFDEYSDWLFNILFDVEKKVDISTYTPQQARIFGFMSERLLEVWVRQKQLRVKHYRVMNTEMKYSAKDHLVDLASCIMNPFKY